MNTDNSSIGFLQVAVKTANGALPVPNANVSIYSYSDNEGEGSILYSLTTDNDGKTDKVALKAKSKALSMSPSDSEISPFTTYNIKVSADGFYENSYINAPIFEGITSIQPVELIPVLEYSDALDDYPSSSRRYIEVPNTRL